MLKSRNVPIPINKLGNKEIKPENQLKPLKAQKNLESNSLEEIPKEKKIKVFNIFLYFFS